MIVEEETLSIGRKAAFVAIGGALLVALFALLADRPDTLAGTAPQPKALHPSQPNILPS